MTRASFRRAAGAFLFAASLLAASAVQVLAGGGTPPYPR